jgi:hypothetical protein
MRQVGIIPLGRILIIETNISLRHALAYVTRSQRASESARWRHGSCGGSQACTSA